MGDGVSDDVGPFQSAISAAIAAGGSVVHAPSGKTYKLNSGLTLGSNVALELGDGAVLDFSGCAVGTVLIAATGLEGTATLLTANAPLGATSVAVVSASGLVAGDAVRIGSDKQFDSKNTHIPIGELNRIKSIASLVVTLETPVQDAYNTADGAVLSKITPVRRVRLRGGTILGGGEGDDHRGVVFTRCDSVIVEGVEFRETSVSGVELIDTTHAVVSHCLFKTFWDNAAAYGTTASCASSDIEISENHFIDVRHAITCSGSASTRGIPRRVQFHHNTVLDSSGPSAGGAGAGDAVDTHGGCEQIVIESNIIHGASGNGINFEGRSGRIAGNQITNPGGVAGVGISVKNLSDYAGDIDVCDNTVRNSPSHGIRLSQGSPPGGDTPAYRSIKCHGNRVLDPTGVGIYIDTPNTDKNAGVSVIGNHVYGAASTIASIYLENVDGAVVIGNVIAGGTAVGAAAIRLDDSVDVTVVGNDITLASAATGSAIYINATSAGATLNVLVDANRVDSPSASSSKGLTLANNAQSCTVGPSNDFRSCTTETSRGSGVGHRIYPAANVKIQTLTLATDTITLDSDTTQVAVDTEGAALTDNLITINGGVVGQEVTFYAADGTHDVVVTDNTGNIRSVGNFTLDTIEDSWRARFNGTNWCEIARSNN
jgi:hypothetical protein